MEAMSAIIYDCRVVAVVEPNHQNRKAFLRYADAWKDRSLLGLAVIGVYDYVSDSYQVYRSDVAEDFSRFQKVANKRSIVVGFNSARFDDELLAANGMIAITTYDLLLEIYYSSGLDPVAERYDARYRGYKFADICQVNFKTQPLMSDTEAAELWQQGLECRQRVCAGLAGDLQKMKALFDQRGSLISPTDGEPIALRSPVPYRPALQSFEPMP